MKITYYGHSCFLFKTEKVALLVDPFIGGNELAGHIKIDAIDCTHILLSHGHQDHILDAEAIARRTGAQIVAGFEIANWYGDRGLDNVLPMNTGGQVSLEDVHLKWVAASHGNSLPDGSYAGVACGMVLTSGGKKIYYAGDTALTMEMELIKRYDRPDLAILPIGDHFTMGVEDATRACDMIGCDQVIGMHYDTFSYIKIDKNAAKETFSKAGKELTLMDIGQSIDW